MFKCRLFLHRVYPILLANYTKAQIYNKPTDLDASVRDWCYARKKMCEQVTTKSWLNSNWLKKEANANNRPFPSCCEPHYESEGKCKVFVMKISFHSYANKTNFENDVLFQKVTQAYSEKKSECSYQGSNLRPSDY